MAGACKLLDNTPQTVTSTVTFSRETRGGHGSATFLWNITSISGTWDCAVYIDLAGSRLKIAELLGQTTTGIKRLALTSDFNATRMAIPDPTSVTYTEAVAGSLTSDLYAVYGD